METLTYQQRIGLVLRHIEQHLDARPNLEELARIACFSPYHFHRIFSSMVGESVAAYVRRLLLERAAMQLGHSPESVTQIALGAGYDSVDAFTRAFRAHLGMLPSEYRRRKGHLEVARRRDLTRPLFYHEMSDLPPMNVRVENLRRAWWLLCGIQGRMTRVSLHGKNCAARWRLTACFLIPQWRTA